MTRQLPADCLNDIFEYLENDKVTLHSCLLTNRLWCEVSVGILWRNIWNLKYSVSKSQWNVSLQILSTLVACLPDESKAFLHEKEIFITTPTSKPPLFNYASFCKILSIHEVCETIQFGLHDHYMTITIKHLVLKEVLKMFMNQISSLKELDYRSDLPFSDVAFINFPGAMNCLTNLSILKCDSDISSEFFCQLSQTCHNIQSLVITDIKSKPYYIEYRSFFSKGLKDLISSQNNLKSFTLQRIRGDHNLKKFIIPSLTKHSNTLIKLEIEVYRFIGLSFISVFSNLQELSLSFEAYRYGYGYGYNHDGFEEFEKLQYVTFSQLRILRFKYRYPKHKYPNRFLETHGMNLRELYIHKSDDSLNLSMVKFCPNLKSMFIGFLSTETLKIILNGYHQLENIEIDFEDHPLSKKKEFFEILVNYSPKNFCELKFFKEFDSKLTPEDLEEFFINWKSRTPQKSLLLTLMKDYHHGNNLVKNKENMKVIENYKKLGVIKNFGIR